ncbi:MAG: exo-alpha-sialidase [Anaerolineae bacterium]
MVPRICRLLVHRRPGASRPITCRTTPAVLACLCALLAPLAVDSAPALGTSWEQAVNLSLSGSASQPMILRGSGDALRTFWWDRFDGLTSATYNGEAWSAASAAPILVWNASREENVPLAEMPEIVTDGGSYCHAFWLAQPAETEQGSATREGEVLWHSTLPISGTTWSAAQVVAQSVLGWKAFADPAGAMHVVYVRAQNAADAPSGIYHTQAAAGQSTWSTPALVQGSIYARLLTADEIHLAGAADDAGNVNIAWRDARESILWMARSADGGQTWGAPTQAPVDDGVAPYLTVTSSGQFLALWRVAAGGMDIALYQQRSLDGGSTWDTPERVLPELAAPIQEITLEHTAGGLLLAAGEGSYALALASWASATEPDAADKGWSEPLSVALTVRNPETGRAVSLESLRLAVTEGYVTLVGAGQDGEIWAVRRNVETMAWEQATASPWSQMTDVAQSAQIRLPAIAADAEGHVHAVWIDAESEDATATLMYAYTDGTAWTPTVQVLQLAESEIEDLALAVAGDQLVAVWNDAQSGSASYSRAFVQDASSTTAWEEVSRLPIPAGTSGVVVSPRLTVDLAGGLHVLYAVPLNEGRGVYYLRSEDGGNTWSTPSLVFDAAGAGWTRVGQASLAVDVDGTLYAAWARLPMFAEEPEAIYWAASADGGAQWSEAIAVAEGQVAAPLIGVSQQGQAHVLWRAYGDDQWSHRWSQDGGATWTGAEAVTGYVGLQGQPSLTYDRAGTLHLVGIAQDTVREPLLRYASWNAETEHWSLPSDAALGSGFGEAARVAAALLADRGRLALLAEFQETDGGDVVNRRVMSTQRGIPAVEQLPAPVVTATPTAAPTQVPTATPQLKPTPTINTGAPAAQPQSVTLGPLSMPLAGVGGLALTVFLIVGTAIVRRLRSGE